MVYRLYKLQSLCQWFEFVSMQERFIEAKNHNRIDCFDKSDEFVRNIVTNLMKNKSKDPPTSPPLRSSPSLHLSESVNSTPRWQWKIRIRKDFPIKDFFFSLFVIVFFEREKKTFLSVVDFIGTIWIKCKWFDNTMQLNPFKNRVFEKLLTMTQYFPRYFSFAYFNKFAWEEEKERNTDKKRRCKQNSHIENTGV